MGSRDIRDVRGWLALYSEQFPSHFFKKNFAGATWLVASVISRLVLLAQFSLCGRIVFLRDNFLISRWMKISLFVKFKKWYQVFHFFTSIPSSDFQKKMRTISICWLVTRFDHILYNFVFHSLSQKQTFCLFKIKTNKQI